MIRIENLTKIFNEGTKREFCAIKDISLHVKKGEISLLSGVSGSGKSTLLALIAGLYKPSFGEVIINNQSISKLSENFASKFRRENIGIIFQSYNLIPTLNVLDNILLPTLPDKKDLHVRADELLERFKMQDKKNELARNLSGGEAQRIAIIRALINSPSLILADEPTANLDKKLSLKLLEFLELIQSLGHTILIATHDPIFHDWGKATSEHKIQKVNQ